MLIQAISQETTVLLQDSHHQNDRMLEFPPSMYISCPTLGCHLLPVLVNETLLKMIEVIISDLLLGVPYDSLNMKRQKLIECVLTENSKQYLGKAYTKEWVNELNEEEVDKPFSNYEVKLWVR